MTASAEPWFDGLTNQQIADHRTADGLYPPNRNRRFTAQRIQGLIVEHGLRDHQIIKRRAALRDLASNEWSVADLATKLGIPVGTIQYWIKQGKLAARRAPNSTCWIITAGQAERDRIRYHRAHPPSYDNRQRRIKNSHQTPGQEGKRHG